MSTPIPVTEVGHSEPSVRSLRRPAALSAELRVFLHHIYEYEKGVRRMVLCTLRDEERAFACERLAQKHIDYLVQPTPGQQRVNIFFGHPDCIRAVSLFAEGRPLNSLSAEEDFIIGALLGYDVCVQCKRYCRRKSASGNATVE